MRRILLIAVAVFFLNPVARADRFTIIGSRAAQNPSDFIDWTQLGPDGTVLTTPQIVTTFNGHSVRVGNRDSSNFERVDEGLSWVGNFDSGESLVTNVGSSAPFRMELPRGVSSFGFSISSLLNGAFTATVTAYDCSGSFNELTTKTFRSTSNNLENDSAAFVGLGDTSGANVCAITIATADASGANNFAIDDVSFTSGEFEIGGVQQGTRGLVMNLTTPSSVQKLQKALHDKANRGAASEDGQTFEAIEDELTKELKSSTDRPQFVPRVCTLYASLAKPLKVGGTLQHA